MKVAMRMSGFVVVLLGVFFSAFTFLPVSWITSASAAEVKTSPGMTELIICSQNLNRVGAPLKERNWREMISQREQLIARFLKARCDVIGVQEVFGENITDSRKILENLARDLSAATGRKYTAYVGDNRHDQIRNGFLVSERAGQVLRTVSFSDPVLPKLAPLGPPSNFTRFPFGLVLDVPARNKPGRKKVLIISYHFKAKVQGWKDPTGTDYETVRMEMAEALRLWALQEEMELGKDTVVVLLGDRNSDEESAAADILRGARTLADFRRGGGCALTRELHSTCQVANSRPPAYVGLLQYRKQFSGENDGSYRFRGRLEIIDDILVEGGDLNFFLRATGEVAVGTTGEFNKGSDHKLVWTELNW